MMKKLWRLETGIFFGVWLILMVFGRAKLFDDPGTFWHVVVGDRILSTGNLIYSDTFSFTQAGHYWIAQEWLGECVMALIHRIAGFDSLLLAAVTLLASFYTWLAHRLLRSGIHPLLTIFLISLTIVASCFHFLIRPLLATIVFLGVTLSVLADFEKGRTSLGKLFWLIPLFVLWANLHGGYLGGMGTLVIVVGGWIFIWLIGWEGPISGGRQVAALVALTILCGLAALANPYGVALPKAWFSIMSSPVIAKIIIEHMPLWSFKFIMAIVMPAALLYISALAGVLPERPRVTWLVPLVWLFLGFDRARFAPLFATTFAVVIPDMLPHIRWVGWLSQKGSEVCRIRDQREGAGAARLTQFIIPVMVIILTLTLQASGVRAPVFGSGWARIDPGYWPVGMLGELRAIESRQPTGTRIFNDMLYGGFLIYYAPRLRIFIDDRCELYGDKGLSVYTRLDKNPERIDSLAREFGFSLALVKSASAFDRYLSRSENWSLLKRSRCADLFKRVSYTPQGSAGMGHANVTRP